MERCRRGEGDMMPLTSVTATRRTRVRRGCRMVTTSLTARVLLANQLRSLAEIAWTVVSGDRLRRSARWRRGAAWCPSGGSSPFRRRLVRPAVAAAPSAQRFDFVQTHTPKASFLGLPAARLAGSPAIYTIHGSLYFEGNGRKANVLGWCFERWCCAWADRVLVQSPEDERVLPRRPDLPGRQAPYLGNGIVMDRFPPPVTPALSSDRPLVVMVSRLVREKGCADFLALAASLAGKADFVHVGPFEHDQSDALTDAEVAEATESGTVRFIGEVDDVRPYLASADLVVLPSYREGIPRVAMEASAMGRPVAGYNIRGMREVIDPAWGTLAPRGDLAGLAAVVEELLGDPVRRAELGKRGRDRVVAARYSEDVVIERLRAVYDEVGAVDMTPQVCLTVDVEDWYDGMAVLGEHSARPSGRSSGLSGLADLLERAPGARGDPVRGGQLRRDGRERVGRAGRARTRDRQPRTRPRPAARDPADLVDWLRRGRRHAGGPAGPTGAGISVPPVRYARRHGTGPLPRAVGRSGIRVRVGHQHPRAGLAGP